MEYGKVIRGKTLGAWKKYAEDEYHFTPVQVVKYINILEEELSNLNQNEIVGNSLTCIGGSINNFAGICTSCGKRH